MTFLRHGPALLFCPGDRPDRFDKAASRADVVVLDLEDAVAPERKHEAREAVAAAAARLGDRAIVRVNATGTAWHEADVSAMRAAGVGSVMLPKVASAADLAGLEDLRIVALCETAAGIAHCTEIAAVPHCVALFWGGEDLIADLGGRSSRDDTGRLLAVVEYARSVTLLAARAAGKPAIDAIEPDIGAVERLIAAARDAADSGFAAKACIHPDHVGAIRSAFAATPEQLSWARGVLATEAEAGGGVFRFGGRMIDAPLLAHARIIVEKERAWTCG
ncbi:CoA ester lyase [Pseudonocardia kujensis]|uniref:HpcH/HpaI aldolase/citrate lyase family protein n=1 Tax=Pseudonocardia kujensis TaxID=1128675 RepID=UPI001E5D1B64|nr:CoA ester lyase [Pseudonocardia kujensis]MCE0765582.1 CoA ester lyase [Pseudonocardia kujensis]